MNIFRCIMQCTHVHGIICCNHKTFTIFTFCKCCPSYITSVTIFLWSYISIFKHIGYCVLINADFCTCFSVHIVFLRSSSVISNIFVLFWNSHAHTNLCNIANCTAVCRCKAIGYNNISVCINLIVDCIWRINTCNCSRNMNIYNFFFCFYTTFFYLEVFSRIFHSVCKVRVIADSCSPIIRFWSLFQKDFIIYCIVRNIACSLINCYRKFISVFFASCNSSCCIIFCHFYFIRILHINYRTFFCWFIRKC